jgi:hypothetical protein
MLKTEEEFCLELRAAVDHYVKALELEDAPQEAKDHLPQLLLGLPAIQYFHAKQVSKVNIFIPIPLFLPHCSVLLKGLQYYSDDPGKVGQTFVRLERDFEQHVAFMRELDSTLRMVQEVHAISQYLEVFPT